MTRAMTTAATVAVFLFFLGSTHPQPERDIPCAIHIESLVYEPFARQTGIAGDVKLQIDIDDVGNVSDERVIIGHPLLLKEAEKNIKLWRFKPGHPATFSMTYEFRLVDPGSDKGPFPTISYDLPSKVRVISSLPSVDHPHGEPLP